MSDTSKRTHGDETSVTLTRENSPSEPLTAKRFPPVTKWAVTGGALLIVELFFIIKWVSGPDFTSVPYGPDQPPQWMKVVLDGFQLASWIGALFCLYWFLIRPWRRQGRVPFDGLVCIAAAFAAPWDGLSSAPRQWFGYNAYLLNRSSILSALPGVASPNGQGYGQAWPLFAIPMYIILFPLLAILGSAVMRRAKRIFPRLSAVGLIFVCIGAMMVMDFIIEGILLMPLGFYSYAGGVWPITFPGTYYQFPFSELLQASMWFSVAGVFRYFTNERGETFVERGANTLAVGPRRQLGMRSLAVIAGLHLSFLAVYHVPMMLWTAASPSWPQDVKQRSYFLGNLCGARDLDHQVCSGVPPPQSQSK